MPVCRERRRKILADARAPSLRAGVEFEGQVRLLLRPRLGGERPRYGAVASANDVARYLDAARALSAASSGLGKGRPLLSARPRIPAQAFGLKENLDGTSPCGSKIADKEQTAASLGHSVELSVKYSPRHAIPEFIQALEQASEILPVRGRERAGHVLP